MLVEPGRLVGCCLLSEEKGAQPGSCGIVLCLALQTAAPRAGLAASSLGLQRRCGAPSGAHSPANKGERSVPVYEVLWQKRVAGAVGGVTLGRFLASFDWSEGHEALPWERRHSAVQLWPEEARPVLSNRNRVQASSGTENFLVATLEIVKRNR